MAEYVRLFFFLRLRAEKAAKERIQSLSPPISGDGVVCRILPLHMFCISRVHDLMSVGSSCIKRSV